MPRALQLPQISKEVRCGHKEYDNDANREVSSRNFCRKNYAKHKSCNFFVKDVAKALNESVPIATDGRADDIVNTGITTWRTLTEDEATQAASEGYFVIAGMTAKELGESEGHVAVVVPGKLHGFPRVWATREIDSPKDPRFGKSQGDTSLTLVFKATLVHHHKVHFLVKPSLGLEAKLLEVKAKLLWNSVTKHFHH